MKKKTILLLAAALVVAMAAYVGVRLSRRGTDIIGVTTLSDRNVVIMNAKTGTEFVSGQGKLTVGQGERVHLEYALNGGSFDLALSASATDYDAFHAADLQNLSETGDVFGASGVSGSGSLDLAAQPGEYTVFFEMHEAVGTARVSAISG